MANSSLSLDRLLNTPHLDRIVPRLQPEVLLRVIGHYGLEHSAELIALASPAQITSLLDADVWRVRAGTTTEAFDAERFGVWLSVLMQSGTAVAADKLTRIDRDLVVAGLTGHVAVFDAAAVSAYMSLEGDYVKGRTSQSPRSTEIGGYFIEAKQTTEWDGIVELLTFLGERNGEYFHRLMRDCVQHSDGGREADGFHNLLEDDEQQLFDVAAQRAGRREATGFVSPTEAEAFLQDARRLRVDSPAPPTHVLAESYFRALGSLAESTPDESSDRPSPPATPDATRDATSSADAEAAAVVAMLADAGVLGSEPQRLLAAGHSEERLALVQSHVLAHPSAGQELAYLANVLIAGVRLQGRAFTPQEASDAAAATCNLGLEHWPERWRHCELVTAFQVGWQILHREVCLAAAQRLAAILPTMSDGARIVQLRLTGLRMRLTRAIADATPWDARDHLDVLLPFDAEAWAGLAALLAECPVINAAVRGSQATHAIDVEAFEFMSSDRDVAVARQFVERLGAALGGS